jgi:uncharacterized SAM-binding protein YcdF (DUF218 family)
VTYTEPLLTVFLAVSLAGCFFVTDRTNRRACRLLATGLTALFLLSWQPADWLFSRPLEWTYRNTFRPERPAQAIVVLSSYVAPSSRSTPVTLPDEMTYGRCRYTAWLYRNWQPLPIFVSGGGSSKDGSYARSMAHLLEAEGIPAGQLVLEERSSSTYENAVFTAELLRHKGIRTVALVVEADSMLRAEMCFRKQGIDVIPAPLQHRTLDYGFADLLPSWQAIQRNERTLHELGGLIWYKIRGWI